MTRIALFTAAMLLLLGSGVASADGAAMPMGAANPADKAFMSSMQSMNTAMGGPMSGDADKDFVLMMLPHHQGAVAMAKTEIQFGKDPLLRKLAQDIVAAQAREIATMRAWQAKHRQ